jgi:hypothetical protein
MASTPFLTLGVLAVVVLMAGGASLLWYRRKVRRRQRQNSWRELCLRLELAPQPGDARVGTGELPETLFLLHDTGSEWLVELPLAQPLLPPGMVLLSPNAPSLPPHLEMRPLEWGSASLPEGMQAWIVEGEELSGKVEAPQAFLHEAARAMQAHAPLRVEPRRLIQALRADSLLSVNEAREAVRALAATARRWLEVAEHSGRPGVQTLPQPQLPLPSSQEVQAPPPAPSPPSPPSKSKHKRKRARGDSPHELVVDFNALPRLTRERLVTSTGPSPEVAPILAHQRFRSDSLWTRAVAWVGALSLLGLAILTTNSGFGVNHPEEFGFVYAAAVFCFLAASIVLILLWQWRRTLPFAPGRYVFARDFVDATTRQLRIIPLSVLAEIETKDHYSSARHGTPVYKHSVITLLFPGKQGADHQGAEEFVIRGKDLAEAQSRHLREMHQALVSGTALNDKDSVRRIDPFFEARREQGGLEALQNTAPNDSGNGPLARELPRWMQPASVVFLFWLAAVASLLLGFKLWRVSDHMQDETAFETARQQGSARAFKEYADNQGRHKDEAIALGSQLTFQDCEKQDTVECWEEFLELWGYRSPRSEEVRERLSRLVLERTPRTVAALKNFLDRFDRSVVATEVRERLLPEAEFQEVPANNVSALRHFRQKPLRPWADERAQARIHELFTAAQTELQNQASPQNPQAVLFLSQVLTFLESSESGLVHVRFRRQVAPSLAGPWDASSTERLEGRTVKALGNAFQQLFAEGILTLVHGESLPEQPEATDVTRPRIDIRYTISRSDVTSSGGRQLEGLQFDFDVALRRPGAQPVRVSFQVKPPQDVQFGVMAQRAFEELSGKLGTLFFRADSKALQALHPRAP